MAKYRIKTKEEFKKEFGRNWRDQVMFGFSENMDYLFGRTLTESQCQSLNDKKYCEILYEGFGFNWSISIDMVVKIGDPITSSVRFTYDDKTVTATYDGISATATCSPEDKFDLNKGLAIALFRLAKKLGAYDKEVVVTKTIVEHKNILDEIDE